MQTTNPSLVTNHSNHPNFSRIFQYTLVAFILSGLVLYSIWTLTGVGRGSGTRSIIIYGFSILDDVMRGEIFPAFKTQWQNRHDESIEFISSFAGSGTITDQIIEGVPAEIAILSTQSDALRLVENGLLPGPTWLTLPNQGILNRTPFIMIVHKGNPFDIKDFDDLTNRALGIVQPDPLGSGAGQWAILAEFGSAFLKTGSMDQASSQLARIWYNVILEPVSARKAWELYGNGIGEVLVTYEQQFLKTQLSSDPQYEIIYPERSIFSEHLVVRIDRNITSGEEDLVDGFLKFLWSAEGQEIFVRNGFRSVNESMNQINSAFGVIPKPFTINDLGGWKSAHDLIFKGEWRRKINSDIDDGGN